LTLEVSNKGYGKVTSSHYCIIKRICIVNISIVCFWVCHLDSVFTGWTEGILWNNSTLFQWDLNPESSQIHQITTINRVLVDSSECSTVRYILY
jgi:hypothetical protein